MNKKFFKKPEPQCKYCEYGNIGSAGDCVVCKKIGGIMQPFSKCKKFKYDPLKREPKVITFNSDFENSDFSL